MNNSAINLYCNETQTMNFVTSLHSKKSLIAKDYYSLRFKRSWIIENIDTKEMVLEIFERFTKHLCTICYDKIVLENFESDIIFLNGCLNCFQNENDEFLKEIEENFEHLLKISNDLLKVMKGEFYTNEEIFLYEENYKKEMMQAKENKF